MSGVRRAALYLYSLHADDQYWLLKNLSSDQRSQLQTVMDELELMSIEKHKACFPELVQASAKMNAGLAESDEMKRQVAIIEAAHPQQILEVLEGEPSRVVAQILGYRMWSWRPVYLAEQDVQKKQCLLRTLEDPAGAAKPKVQSALVAALAARLNLQAERQAQTFDAVLYDAEYPSNNKIKLSSRWGNLWRR